MTEKLASTSQLAEGTERSARILAALTDATYAIASSRSSGEEALEDLAAVAARLTGANIAVIDFDEPDRPRLVAAHLDDEHADLRDVFVPPPVWLQERLADAPPSGLHLEGTEVGERAGLHDGGLTVLATPLRSPSRGTIGLAYVARHPGTGGFTPQDRAVLEHFAALAVVTMENARLYEAHARQEAARFRDDLLAGMSHDMLTPLSVIVGIAESLTDHPDLPLEERLQIYATVARQARRMRSLVNQFLDFSRIEADRPLTLDVRPLDVVEVIDDVIPLFTHHREIIVGAEESLPPARADRERLEQILINLVSNAVKYSDGPVRVVARGVDEEIIVDVVDEGQGLTDEELSLIFEKFHRGTAAEGTRGTGLGLYISRALVEAQGGELHAMSAGMGSRFRVRLPAA